MVKGRIKSVLAVAVVMAMIFTSMAVPSFAAGGKTKKMTVYSDVLVSGNYAYCAGFVGLYKVNLNTGKKTCLVKRNPSFMIHAMKKKGSYIYYEVNGPISNDLYRVKTNGKNGKKLYDGMDTKAMESYVILDRKIYITYGNNKNKVMNLDGSSKKKTSVKAKMIEKVSNKKGYKVIEKAKGDYFYYYLKYPSGKKKYLDKTWY